MRTNVFVSTYNDRLNNSTRLFTCFIGYIDEFKEMDDHRGGKIVVQLKGRYVILRSSSSSVECQARLGIFGLCQVHCEVMKACTG
jgi:hypothetical protein